MIMLSIDISKYSHILLCICIYTFFSEATPELPELTPTLAVTAATSTAQQKIIELRSWIFSTNAQSLGAPGDLDRYSAGLRAAAQAYYVVYNKADNNPGGLAGIWSTQSAAGNL